MKGLPQMSDEKEPMQALGDTIRNMVGTGGSISAKNATAVGFDPRLHPDSLVINAP